MTASFQWIQTHGTSASPTNTALGISGNLFNYKRANDATAGNYSSYPITAGTNSFEVILRGRWTGTFNTIQNLQFWQSVAFSPATGLTLKWKGNNQTAYNFNATTGTSTRATSAMPTSDPATANVSIGGNLAGSLASSGYSDYIVTQLQTTSAAAAGDTSLATFTMQYDEN